VQKLPQIDQIKDALMEAAELDVLPRFQQLASRDIIEKSPGDVVTIADVEAEERLTKSLAALLPGSVVVGEEAHHKNPDIINRIKEHDYVWLIDPVDGTANFVAGSPTFCVMAALVVKGEPTMACIYDPITKNVAFAEKDNGAYLNNVPIKTQGAVSFEDMVGQVNLGLFEKNKHDNIKLKLNETFKTIDRMRCAGQDFVNQALGRRHFALYRYLWSWDHVPGVLILKEAGGHVACIDAKPYQAQDRVHGLLSAPDKESWDALNHFFKNLT